MDTENIPRVNLIILGDTGVGKTSLLEQFFDGIFKQTKESTTAVNSKEGILHVSTCRKSVNVHCWDTSGQPTYDSIIGSYLKGVQGALLVYDVSWRDSFERVKFWSQELDRKGNNVNKFIIGNKIDKDPRILSREEGLKFAKQISARFKETSAKNFDDALLVFEILIYEILSQRDEACLTLNLSNNLEDENAKRNQVCKALILLRPLCPVIEHPQVDTKPSIELLVVGASGVGKTCLVSSYCDGNFKSLYRETLGVDCRLKRNNAVIPHRRLRIWDFGGSKQCEEMLDHSAKTAKGFIFVCDATSVGSFQKISLLCSKFHRHYRSWEGRILLVNKSDLDHRDDPTLNEKFKLHLNSAYKLPCIETSAKEGSNVKIAINSLLQEISMHESLAFSHSIYYFALRKDLPEFEIKMKIIMLGSSGVGKTSLMSTYGSKRYKPNTAVTIGVEFITVTFRPDKPYGATLVIQDTAGQEKYQAIVRSYFRNVQGAVLVYDVTDENSFDVLKNKWLPHLRTENPDENLKIIVVGNKVDKGSREVSVKEAEEFAENNGAAHIETSAKSYCQVQFAFEYLAKEILMNTKCWDKIIQKKKIKPLSNQERRNLIVNDAPLVSEKEKGCSC